MPNKVKDRSGERTGRLTAVRYLGSSYWECACDCGSIKTVKAGHLQSGAVKSCGCLYREGNNRTHGMSNAPTWNSWSNMISRCYRTGDKDFHKYGGRGISVCEEWRGSFLSFYLHMGDRPKGKSLDRIDVNGNYGPGNCRWATPMEQNRNQRINVFYEMDGKRMIAPDWAKHLGLRKGAINMRLKAGWDLRRALTTPKIPSGPVPRG